MTTAIRPPQVMQTVHRLYRPAVHFGQKAVKCGGRLMELFTAPLSRREQLSQQSEGEILRKVAKKV